MQKVDFIIVGLGWAGSMVAYELVKKGYAVAIYDNDFPFAATPNTAAIINPISGKKRNTVANYELYFKVAQDYYNELAVFFDQSFLSKKPILLLNEIESITQKSSLLNPFIKNLSTHENNMVDKAFGIQVQDRQKIDEAFLVDAKNLMQHIKQFLNNKAVIHNKTFETKKVLWQTDGVQYENLFANKIIFTRGAIEQKDNNIIDAKCFTPNRGDHLTVMIPDLSEDYIYDIGMRLVPLGNHMFWMGSNNIWDINSVAFNVDFRANATQLLKYKLKYPFQILDYNIGFRPTTPGQKVIIEQVEEKPFTYIFNGLGTRGFSLGPYYLQQFLHLIIPN